ncbi:MAG: T9SS type A sorting domain-containing protein [Bacteroidetes bacterium]|nr:T9SS type A sorting domain-containing protein [Bacteroidota bacterium]MBL6944767.1 T9SS type A sorting domain-containing protein [Bacteroidales bacterium]
MNLRVIYIVVALVISQGISAQSRWTMQYYGEKDAIGISIKASYDNGYLVLGKHGSNYVNYNWLIKTNVNGEIIWEKTFGSPSSNIKFSEIDYNTEGDLYLVGLTGYYSEDDYDPLIMKLNACGEKQWCRVFIEDDNNFANALVVTPDDGVVVVLRYMSTIPFTDRICLVKFDIAGDMQWKQCYNSPDTSVYNEDAYDLTMAPDGGFLITGRCTYEDPNPPHAWWNKPYYIKTDSEGNFEWEATVHMEISDIGGKAWNTVLSPDSNYFYSSLSHYYHPPFGDSPALLKMDMNGNVVDIYDLAPIDEYGKMIEAKFISDTTLMASAIWGNELIGGPKAVVIDTLGNMLHDAHLLDNKWMASTDVTKDGKLLFFTNMLDENDELDAYLFKLNQQLESDSIYTQPFTYDSLCQYQIVSDTIVQDGCGLIVGTEEHYHQNDKNDDLLKIYPNPTKDVFTIESDIIGIDGALVEIVGLYGQKIKNIKVPKGQTEVVINIKDWQKGLYLVRMLHKNGLVESGKVIIQ